MGTYEDRNVPDPGNSGIQAGNQQQHPVEGLMHEPQSPHTRYQGRHEYFWNNTMSKEGINAPE
eukprot:6788908-Prorocentrum_lima.AAC.1